jgi:hypothetical protein
LAVELLAVELLAVELLAVELVRVWATQSRLGGGLLATAVEGA